jgi:hypothetical protein
MTTEWTNFKLVRNVSYMAQTRNKHNPLVRCVLEYYILAKGANWGIIRGGAGKSLARAGSKQVTTTKLGIYSPYSPRSSIHFLSCCCNFCKPLKKFRSFCVQPGLRGSNDFRVGQKMATFQFFQSREQVVVRRGQIRRIWWVIKIVEAR